MLSLEIITPEETLVKEEVDVVEAQGAYGEFGILPGHTQFLTTIKVGEVRYTKDDKIYYLSTGGGFAEVVDDKVVFLLDVAEPAETINVDRAQKARERAEHALRTLTYDDVDYRMYELALLKAISRISVAKHLG